MKKAVLRFLASRLEWSWGGIETESEIQKSLWANNPLQWVEVELKNGQCSCFTDRYKPRVLIS